MEVGARDGGLRCLTADWFGFGASLNPWPYVDSPLPLSFVMPHPSLLSGACQLLTYRCQAGDPKAAEFFLVFGCQGLM